jgi:hypothetical protein
MQVWPSRTLPWIGGQRSLRFRMMHRHPPRVRSVPVKSGPRKLFQRQPCQILNAGARTEGLIEIACSALGGESAPVIDQARKFRPDAQGAHTAKGLARNQILWLNGVGLEISLLGFCPTSLLRVFDSQEKMEICASGSVQTGFFTLDSVWTGIRD